jgi:hypothetical protein
MNQPLQKIIANRYRGRDIPIALVLPDGDRVPLSETPEVDVYARTWQGLKTLAPRSRHCRIAGRQRHLPS